MMLASVPQWIICRQSGPDVDSAQLFVYHIEARVPKGTWRPWCAMSGCVAYIGAARDANRDGVALQCGHAAESGGALYAAAWIRQNLGLEARVIPCACPDSEAANG